MKIDYSHVYKKNFLMQYEPLAWKLHEVDMTSWSPIYVNRSHSYYMEIVFKCNLHTLCSSGYIFANSKHRVLNWHISTIVVMSADIVLVCTDFSRNKCRYRNNVRWDGQQHFSERDCGIFRWFYRRTRYVLHNLRTINLESNIWQIFFSDAVNPNEAVAVIPSGSERRRKQVLVPRNISE